MKKTFLYTSVSIATLLSGCLATVNLLDANSSILSKEQRIIAHDIAERTKSTCIRYTYIEGSNQKISGDMKLTGSIEIKRMYTSDSGWFKAHILSQGIWDNVYYNPVKFKFICGEKQWGEYSESTKIQFTEIGLQAKSLENIPISIKKIQPNSDPDLLKDRLNLLKELRQKDLITEIQYNEQVNKALLEK
ncbi:MAG: hypothetical protein ACOYB1_10145 [Limnohabitans sp.]